MAKMLRNVGFEVVEGSNIARDKMTEKLLDFGKKAEGADVALFFYIAVTGTNYLLPVDADLKSEMDVKLGAAINVDLTLEQTMGDAKVNEETSKGQLPWGHTNLIGLVYLNPAKSAAGTAVEARPPR